MHLVAFVRPSVCPSVNAPISAAEGNYPQVSNKEYNYQSVDFVCVSVIRGLMQVILRT